MTVATTSDSKNTQGRIALWRCAPDKSAVFTGRVSVTLAMLQELQNQIPDEYGQIHLDVLGFANQSENPSAPAYTGYCRLPENRPTYDGGDDEEF